MISYFNTPSAHPSCCLLCIFALVTTLHNCHILQISDAKVVISDPKPGASETVITISGTPEQTNAAQSLIQAFVLSETEST